MLPEKKYMLLAIKHARSNFATDSGGPFGAVIVKEDRVIAAAANSVLENDPTAHAEINAIRLACEKLKTYDLTGTVIYSTTEPCPMCFSAVHWARIDAVIYGTSISDVAALGFNELSLSNQQIKQIGGSPVNIIPSFMHEECRQMLKDWQNLKNKRTY